MTTNRTPVARERRGRITPAQESALRYGGLSDVFESEEECREAWERHRASMLHLFGNHGRRPCAWWQFEAPAELVYDYETERSTLFEAGLLSETEAAALVEHWRSEFERAMQPGFAFCAGEGPKGGAIWLRGREAREAHLRWADIPRSLIRQWTAERKATA